MNGLEIIINEIKKSLDNNCVLSAFALALIVPDICGNVLYPSEKTGVRYKKWYNEYIGNYEKCPNDSDNMPYLSGELVYALRCSFLHSGNNDVEKEYSDFTLDNFTLRTETKKPFDIYVDEASISEDFVVGKKSNYIVNMRRFCCLIVWASEAFLKKGINNFNNLPHLEIEDLDEKLSKIKNK